VVDYPENSLLSRADLDPIPADSLPSELLTHEPIDRLADWLDELTTAVIESW